MHLTTSHVIQSHNPGSDCNYRLIGAFHQSFKWCSWLFCIACEVHCKAVGCPLWTLHSAALHGVVTLHICAVFRSWSTVCGASTLLRPPVHALMHCWPCCLTMTPTRRALCSFRALRRQGSCLQANSCVLLLNCNWQHKPGFKLSCSWIIGACNPLSYCEISWYETTWLHPGFVF